MATNVEQNRIPESLTINGQTYKISEVPELQAFIQTVAGIEKAKLYSQIESLKQQFKQLQGVTVETPQINLDELAEKLGDKFITHEKFVEQFTKLREDFPGMIKEVVQPVLQHTEQQAQDELEAYRKELIANNEAVCIPDLVKGNTKEELDAALAESIRLRSAYPTPTGQPVHEAVPQNKPQAGVQTPTPAPAAPQAPQVPAAPRREAPAAGGEAPSVKGMSMAEFGSKRDAIRQQLESLYGSPAM